jgi:SAM-dependent methyltransferase
MTPTAATPTRYRRGVDTSEQARNRAVWAVVNDLHTDRAASDLWRAGGVRWGLFRAPDTELGALPWSGDLTGRTVVELGAGTAFMGAALARLGGNVIAVDLSHEQLLTAQRCQQQIGPAFPLVEADGGAVPLRDGLADLVVSEHGASVWCDANRWLPEAARLLRPGGWLVFLTNSMLATLCVPQDEGPAQPSLQRPQRNLYRTVWDGGGVEYHPSHGEWIALLRASGFEVVALHELYAPLGADDPEFYQIADANWAARWPVEDLWVARKAAAHPFGGTPSGSDPATMRS